MIKALQSLSLATALTLSGAAVADAAGPAVRFGETTIAIAVAGGTLTTSVAYDSVNRVYLAVSTYGMLHGRFLDREGRPIGTPFPIQATGNYSHAPAVTFAPEADGGSGGFLVAWHSSDLATATFIHARIVSFRAGGPASAETVLGTELSSTRWLLPPALAYSQASREFLVSWTRVEFGIRAVRLDVNAVPKAPAFAVTQVGQYEAYPSISYNPTNDCFVLVWSGFIEAIATGYVDARLLQAGTNNLLGGARVGSGGGINITDVAYQSATNQFMVGWYRDTGRDGKASMGRLVNADLSPANNIVALSTLWKAYDALGLGYNPISNTFFMISHDGRGLATSIEDGGVELGPSGVPVDNGFLVTAGTGKANYYPRIAASTREPAWLVSTTYGFDSTRTQLVAAGAVQPASSQPMLNIDLPGSPIVQQPFVMAGWGLDRGAASSNGADVIHVWAVPTNGGAPIFAGHTTINVPRPDVASAFGPQFGASGWELTINNLPPGSYQLGAYMRSTITESFSIAKVVAITVADSIMTIDVPGTNTVVPRSGFWIGGWAVDRGAPAGTGVDTLHVWALPHSGGAPRWVGVADYGVARPDVAAAFGSSRFTNSGYNIWVNTLAPGWYDVVVFSHSTVSGTFSQSRSVRVLVQ
jgi:hypothetical protein